MTRAKEITKEAKEFAKEIDDYIIVERVNARPYLRKRGSSDHQKHNAIHREGVTCRHDCKNYPCFKGMENLSSNLAETCHSFKKK